MWLRVQCAAGRVVAAALLRQLLRSGQTLNNDLLRQLPLS
jgi:hypothetical protein